MFCGDEYSLQSNSSCGLKKTMSLLLLYFYIHLILDLYILNLYCSAKVEKYMGIYIEIFIYV